MNIELLKTILACPKCKSPLSWQETVVRCLNKDCSATYPQDKGIIHFSDIDLIDDEELSVTVNSYNQTAQYFAEIHDNTDFEKWVYKTSLEKIKELSEGNIVLDAGSGIGRDSDFLAQSGYNVIGIDISINMIMEGKKFGHYINSTPMMGDMGALPFTEKSFDIIWACASLLHTPKGEKFSQILNEFHYVVKENGLLYTVMMKKDERFCEDGWEIKEERGKRYFSYFTKSELEELLLNSGFEPFSFWESDSRNPTRPSWIHIISKVI